MTLASADEAAVLDVEPDAALLAITRTASDADGDPIEYAHDLFRGDRTRLVVRSGDGGARPGAGSRAAQGRRLMAPGHGRPGAVTG